MPATVGALLLTGGASRRMGTAKAALPAGAGESVAERTGRLLSQVAWPVLEVGPGWTSLPAVADHGEGPLAAIAAGWRALAPRPDAALVVACDLPRLSTDVLTALVGQAGDLDAAVVPEVGGRLQPLCAWYSAGALDTAAVLAGRGAVALKDLLAVIHCQVLPADAWAATLADVDTPEDLDRLGLARPAVPEA
jgi:molybdopterin-guanine dinucleotide biosynthesis protein A